MNDDDVGTPSGSSATMTFASSSTYLALDVVVRPFEQEPVGDAPGDGAQLGVCGTTPVFRAEPVSGSGVQYQFQIATTSTFDAGTIVADSNLVPATNTYTPQPGQLATDGTTYYWRWKTASGSFSTPSSFSIRLPYLGAGNQSGPLWSAGPLSVNETKGNLLVSLPGPTYPTDAAPLSTSVSSNSQLPEDNGLGIGWSLLASARRQRGRRCG